MELYPDIHIVDGVTCNVYVILEADGVTLIDTGMPGKDKALTAYLNKLGRPITDLRRILITHQHVDHIGNLAAFAAASGAETIAHPLDTPAIEGKAPRELPKQAVLRFLMQTLFVRRLKPAPIQRQVKAGEILPVLQGDGGLQVIETPGHTTGHISFYLPGRKLLFAGDAYRHSNGQVAPSPNMLNTDTAQALRSMAALAALDIEASFPGHGAPLLAGGGTKLQETVVRLAVKK